MTTESPLKRPDLRLKERRVPTQHRIELQHRESRAGWNAPTLPEEDRAKQPDRPSAHTIARGGTHRPSLRKVGRSGQTGHQPVRSRGAERTDPP